MGQVWSFLEKIRGYHRIQSSDSGPVPSSSNRCRSFCFACCTILLVFVAALRLMAVTFRVNLVEEVTLQGSESAEIPHDGLDGEDEYHTDDRETLQLAQNHINDTVAGPWFFRDPPGIDPRTPRRTSIWEYEISLKVNASRTDKQRRSPRLYFIKGLKVGGTSVAVALDRVARSYGIEPQLRISESRNREYNPGNQRCNNGSMYYHHGYLNTWMRKCISYARFTTLLRNPIHQLLSWEIMRISDRYYRYYPAKPCPEPKQIDIVSGRDPEFLRGQLDSVARCVDTPFRKNVTIQLVANVISDYKVPPNDHKHGFPGVAVVLTSEWITANEMLYGQMTGDKIVRFLRENYFLVGVTERLNEFLMLIALHMGWDPARMYYRICKPTDIHITAEEFAYFYPDLMKKIQRATRPMMEAYETVRRDLEDHIIRLGPWFQEVVKEFEIGLRAFQASQRSNDRPFRWQIYYHIDHLGESC